MVVAIQQPEHAPWIGFFNKLAQVDLLVLLDDVQFKKRYFENRNKILTAEGPQWVTVPVRSKGRFTQPIDRVEIDNERNWARKYLTSVERSYRASRMFAERSAGILDILDTPWDRLVDLNVALIDQFAKLCGITTPLVRSSQIPKADVHGSDLILELCKQVEASVYVSGPNGRNYLDLNRFAQAQVDVTYHDFKHPTYSQRHEPFVSHLSTTDFLFNVEDTSLMRSCYDIPLSV
jgi:protein-tyrosine-phosphatase